MAEFTITVSTICDHCKKVLSETRNVLSYQMISGDITNCENIARDAFRHNVPHIGFSGPKRHILCEKCAEEYKNNMRKYRELEETYTNEFIHV